MKLTNRKLLVISLFLGLIAASLVYIYLIKIEAESKVVEPTVELVVAKTTIPPKTKITSEMVEIKKFKESDAPQSYFSNLDEVLGVIAKEKIYQGEPINPMRLADSTFINTNLAYMIPEGYRAITLQYNPIMGVGGFIRSGDYVDVIGTFEQENSPYDVDASKIILQNILVLAVGEKVDSEEQAVYTITFAVLPEEAEKITFADNKGNVKLILRPINEERKSSTAGATKENIFNTELTRPKSPASIGGE